MDPKGANADAAVAAIAAKQHGVVTSTQLRSAGLTTTQVRDRIRNGHLHRVYRSVYAVGHPGWALDLWQVATLECWLRHQDEPAWSARKVLA